MTMIGTFPDIERIRSPIRSASRPPPHQTFSLPTHTACLPIYGGHRRWYCKSPPRIRLFWYFFFCKERAAKHEKTEKLRKHLSLRTNLDHLQIDQVVDCVLVDRSYSSSSSSSAVGRACAGSAQYQIQSRKHVLL